MSLGANDMETFIEVGQALAEVRDHHLYRGVSPSPTRRPTAGRSGTP